MAKKRGLGGMLVFGTVGAILGGYYSYKHRREIERTVDDIARQMAASNDLSSVQEEDNVIHIIPHYADSTPQETPVSPEED